MLSHRVAPTAMGLLLVFVGLVVGTGGVWLMALGGSWYYLPSGLLMVLTGLLLLQGSPAALWAHTVLLATTLAWSLWETGWDGWALAARGNVVWLMGLTMLTPWFLRGLDAPTPPLARKGLGAALASFAIVGLAATLLPAGAPDRLARATGAAAEALAPVHGGVVMTGQAAPVAPTTLFQDGWERTAAPRYADVPTEEPLLSPPLAEPSRCPGALLIPTSQGRLVAFNAADDVDCSGFGSEGLADGEGVDVIEFPPFRGFIDHVDWQAAAQALHRDIEAHPAVLLNPSQQRSSLAPASGPAATDSPDAPSGRPLTGATMWGVTLFDQLACRIAFETLRFEGRFARPMALGLLLQTPQLGGRELVVSGPAALMFTAEVVALPPGMADRAGLLASSGGQDAPMADGLRNAVLERAEGAPTSSSGQPIQSQAVDARSPVAGVYAVRLQPFLSPIGLPCQAPPWQLQTAPGALQAMKPAPQPSAPSPYYTRSGRPMAAAPSEASAL
ncbi:hypothetical protein [Acidovorax sp. FG27]|uniref:hypothetical protein n=1 Tax=Acidovorax sp. FG27 TaxID=3133652 RepID=UPI0030EA4484